MILKPLKFFSLHKYSLLLSRFFWPVTVSMDWTGVDLRASVMILDAWFCILLTLSMFDFEAAPYAATTYSTTDHTRPTYIYFCYAFCCLLPRMFQTVFFFISGICSLALTVHLWICCFHVNLGFVGFFLLFLLVCCFFFGVGVLSWDSMCPFTRRCALCSFVARLQIA